MEVPHEFEASDQAAWDTLNAGPLAFVLLHLPLAYHYLEPDAVAPLLERLELDAAGEYLVQALARHSVEAMPQQERCHAISRLLGLMIMHYPERAPLPPVLILWLLLQAGPTEQLRTLAQPHARGSLYSEAFFRLGRFDVPQVSLTGSPRAQDAPKPATPRTPFRGLLFRNPTDTTEAVRVLGSTTLGRWIYGASSRKRKRTE